MAHARSLAPGTLLFVAIAASPALAQAPVTDRDEVIEEIIVTAQKRENLARKVPISLFAESGHYLRQAGIATYVYLLFGTPWETELDAEKTLDFTVRHSETITFLNLALFNLPAFGPQTAVLDTTPLDAGDLSLYRRFTHPAGWHRQKIRRFLNNKFRRHKAIAAILRNDPPVFTSNHAPFFTEALP